MGPSSTARSLSYRPVHPLTQPSFSAGSQLWISLALRKGTAGPDLPPMGWGAGGGDQLGAATPVVSVNFFFFFNVLFIAGLNLHDLNFFFFLIIYLFIYLWLCWVFVSVRGLSLVAASGGHSSSRCVGLSLPWPLITVASLVAEHRLQMRRLSSCGSRAQLLRGMWDLPRPGLEPVSSALAGRFSTTAPPGKP